MRARYVLLGAARDLIVRCLFKYQLFFQIWGTYFVLIWSDEIFQGPALDIVFFFVLFLMNLKLLIINEGKMCIIRSNKRCLFKYQLLFRIWDFLFRVNRAPWNFSEFHFEYCFCVLFLMNWFKLSNILV